MAHKIENSQSCGLGFIFTYLGNKIISALSRAKLAIADCVYGLFAHMRASTHAPASLSLIGRAGVPEEIPLSGVPLVQEKIESATSSIVVKAPTAPIEPDTYFRDEHMEEVIKENSSILFPLKHSPEKTSFRHDSTIDQPYDIVALHLSFMNTYFCGPRIYKHRLNEISVGLQALIASEKNLSSSDLETLQRNQQAIAHFIVTVHIPTSSSGYVKIEK